MTAADQSISAAAHQALQDMGGELRVDEDVHLEPLTEAHLSERYLGWLNDETVNRHSQRAGVRTSEEDARAWINSIPGNSFVFAIISRSFGHVGNVSVGPVDEAHYRAEVAIMIGETSVWGKGIGRQVVDRLAGFFFGNTSLNSLFAGTGNPAFERLVLRCGWTQEGTMRQARCIRGEFRDWKHFSLLRDDYAGQAAVSS